MIFVLSLSVLMTNISSPLIGKQLASFHLTPYYSIPKWNYANHNAYTRLCFLVCLFFTMYTHHLPSPSPLMYLPIHDHHHSPIAWNIHIYTALGSYVASFSVKELSLGIRSLVFPGAFTTYSNQRVGPNLVAIGSYDSSVRLLTTR